MVRFRAPPSELADAESLARFLAQDIRSQLVADIKANARNADDPETPLCCLFLKVKVQSVAKPGVSRRCTTSLRLAASRIGSVEVRNALVTSSHRRLGGTGIGKSITPAA